MKKGLIFFVMLVLPAAFVFAGSAGPVTTEPGSADVNISYNILDFTTIYHYDSGSGVGRNFDFPGYEYGFVGELVHFWAKIDANSVYALEHAQVTVILTHCGGAEIEVPLTFVTGIGATYNPATGKYEGQFQADKLITADMDLGNYEITIMVTDWNGNNEKTDSLTALKYQNVNDLLVVSGDPNSGNIKIVLDPMYGLLFHNLVPLQFANADPYPRHLSITTPVDREGQGVVGNVSIAAQDFWGNCSGGVDDFITADYIRMSKTGGLTGWVWLVSNPYWNMSAVPRTVLPINVNSNFVSLAVNQSTNGPQTACDAYDGVYSANLYFQLYYDANHCATEYDGGQLGVKYVVY